MSARTDRKEEPTPIWHECNKKVNNTILQNFILKKNYLKNCINEIIKNDNS